MAKRKSGPRTAKGRLKNRATPFDYGNIRVELRMHRFAVFGEDRVNLIDPIGRAKVAGLLDNDRLDSTVLMAAGREYARAYHAYWNTLIAQSNMDGECRGGAGLPEDADHPSGYSDKRGEAFEAMDARLNDAGRDARNAVQSLCVDQYHFPDEDPLWVERLLNERFAARGRSVAGMLSTERDRRLLAHAISGLLALCEGQVMRRAA